MCTDAAHMNVIEGAARRWAGQAGESLMKAQADCRPGAATAGSADLNLTSSFNARG
jgi:hypothetical protein